jgi:hypothetical protein
MTADLLRKLADAMDEESRLSRELYVAKAAGKNCVELLDRYQSAAKRMRLLRKQVGL